MKSICPLRQQEVQVVVMTQERALGNMQRDGASDCFPRLPMDADTKQALKRDLYRCLNFESVDFAPDTTINHKRAGKAGS